jgi:hypothetical protein
VIYVQILNVEEYGGRTMSLDKVLYNFARKGQMPAIAGSVGSGSLSFDAAGRMIPTAVGKTYFVSDNYGSDNNDGSSWVKAFKTLAVAFAASHANISANKYGWDARNTIFVSGSCFNEDLVVFPQKTDVIGVGSNDAFHMAGIVGNHVPVNTNYGCAFYNIRFLTEEAGVIVTLGSTNSGVEFHGCLFDATGTGHVATIGIQATASPYLKVQDCTFQGAFSTSFITFGAGQAAGTVIERNVMLDGADNGIVIVGTTTAAYMGLIRDNLISCADITIDTTATSLFVVVNNQLISLEAVGASSYVIDLTYASNNMLTGNDVSVVIPDISTN